MEYQKEFPLISFVIPVFNSERTIKRCLESIKFQKYPNFEIIVVDNGSTDNTIEIVQMYTNKIYHDFGNLGSVRQTGVDNSNGEIIGIFDSDVYLSHDMWLINAVKIFCDNKNITTIWPKNVAPPEGPMFQKMYFNVGNLILENRMLNKKGVVGGSGLILKKAIDSVGGYSNDVHWGEDFDLALKLNKKGYEIVFFQEPVFHDTDMGLSIKKFIKKQIIGASSLTINSQEKMNLSIQDILIENLFIGSRGMINGLILEKDISWLFFPILLFLRFYIYFSLTLMKFVGFFK